VILSLFIISEKRGNEVRLCTVQFNHGRDRRFEVLLNVFKASIQRHMPEMKIDDLRIDAPKADKGICYSAVANTAKLSAWVEYVENLEEEAILADCDMVMLRRIEEGFDLDFDVAFTKKVRPCGCPMNGGIMLVRPTEKAKEFFRIFKEVNDKMIFGDRSLLRKWQVRWPGMNQAAFGMIYEEGLFDGKLVDVPTQVWNACDPDWSYIDERTIFMHVKSGLRQAVMRKEAPRGHLALAMKLWYKEAGEVDLYGRASVRIPKRGTKAKIVEMLKRHKEMNNGNRIVVAGE